MNVSKKHFEALAAALVDAKNHASPVDPSIHRAYAESLAFACASFAPKFDRARFLKACGVEV